MSSELLNLAERVVKYAQKLGADEVSCSVSEGSHITIQRRGGQVEQATEATTRGMTVSILANERYSANSTSDMRPEALEPFLKRAIQATTYLEPEPARAQAPAELCGRGATQDELDQDDPAWYSRTAEERAATAEALENAIRARSGEDTISCSAYSADGQGRSVLVMSNGFADENRGAWFAYGGDMTLQDGEKRPESSAYYAARHLADLPDIEAVADEVVRRTRARIGAKPIESGAYPMLLAGRAAGRILGVIAGPMSGGSLHQKRSCLMDKLGESIGSEAFTLIDDPLIPRGLGSRPWDGDAIRSKRRVLVERGVLQQYNIGLYHSRKLGMEMTSGGRSNWVVPPGERDPFEIAKDFDKVILVDGFLGGNSNAATGDFSVGIRGMLLERGEPTQSLAEMNVSGNALSIFHQLAEVANDPWGYSSVRSPSLLFTDVQFSGT